MNPLRKFALHSHPLYISKASLRDPRKTMHREQTIHTAAHNLCTEVPAHCVDVLLTCHFGINMHEDVQIQTVFTVFKMHSLTVKMDKKTGSKVVGCNLHIY